MARFSAIMILLITVMAAMAALAQNPSQRDREDPQRELWSAIKRALLAEDGEKYFEQNIRNSELPALKGTVVSASPAENPDTIVIALSDTVSPEVTLQLIEHQSRKRSDRPQRASFPGRVDTGDEVEFMGIGDTFSKYPFMLTFFADIHEFKLHPH